MSKIKRLTTIMRNSVKFCFITLVIVCTITKGYSQLGRRLTIGAYGGFAKGTGNESFSPNGLSQNIFGSFGGGALGGVNLMYGKSKFVEFGGDLHAATVSKSNSNLNLLTIGPQIQVNLLPADKNIIPYLAGSVNLSFVGFKQNDSSNVIPSGSGSSADASVTSIKTPPVTLGINAALGYKINAGVNFKLSSRLLGFAEAGYNTVFLSGNSAVTNSFPNSKENFNYFSLAVGIKINLIKSISLYK